MKPSVRASSVEGLRSELKDLRRSVLDLHRMGGDFGGSEPPGGSEPQSAAGGIPTLFVAAHNATARSQSVADYVCDGTADQVEINQAMTAIGADDPYMGRVLLSEGEFYTAGAINLGWRTMLEGFGEATVIYPAGAITGIQNDEESTLRNVSVVGDGTAGSKGVVVVGVRSVVESCSISGCQVGIEVQSSSGPASILNCRLGTTTAASPYSIDVLGTMNDLLIHGCVMAHSLRMSSNYTMTLGNRFAVGCSITVLAGNGNCFSGNLLPAGLTDFSDSGTQTQRGTNFSQSVTW